MPSRRCSDELLRPFPHVAPKPVNMTAIEPREILDDLEQGWRGRLAVWRGRIGLVEWDWENTAMPPTPGYSFDAAQLAKQAGAALERLEAIHRELVQALGRDCWNIR